MQSYKKKIFFCRYDIMEVDLGLGGAKNTRERKIYGKGRT
jgi:hypothetical protein